MCKFKNYPRTFHDNWEYPSQSFGCIVSSILPSTSLTPRRNWIYFRPLFATSLRLLFHTLLGFIVIIIIILSTFFHIYLSSNFPLYSIFTMTGPNNSFISFFSYLFIHFFAFSRSNPLQNQQRHVDYFFMLKILSFQLFFLEWIEEKIGHFVPFFFNDGRSFER